MEKRSYSLKELCQAADVTERTVRFYIQEGLLPPPTGAGPFSRYNYEHWLRLQFIKRLKDEFLPLAQIKNVLAAKSLAELEQLAEKSGLLKAGNFPTESGSRLENWLTGNSTLRQQLQETPASYDYKADFDAEMLAFGPGDDDNFAPPAPPAAMPPAPPITRSAALPLPPSAASASAKSGQAASTAPQPAPRPVTPPLARREVQFRGAPQPNEDVPPGMQLAASTDAGASFRRDAPGGSPLLGSISFESVDVFEPDEVPLPLADAPGGLTKDSAAEEEEEKQVRLVDAKAKKETARTITDTLEVAEGSKGTAGAGGAYGPIGGVQRETEEPVSLGESWEKIALAPGVELHVESQVAAKKRNVLQNLIEYAKQRLKNEET